MPGESRLRYAQGISVPRPRGARELIGYSPKLKRRVTLTSRTAFDMWLLLESDPLPIPSRGHLVCIRR